ncbi:regulator of chromosome condensation, RCC1 [Acidisarcina polymorpha]|uniref:Regulator of chromosome condensation, RCC1 n=1 Tax=Acidisarcina polymorpha TaxID=2211140 RepID=A0A2Z5G7S8_9BACT|nr:regulator of chromosome condensation, RCC1 [Acidisarcina polymorpha]
MAGTGTQQVTASYLGDSTYGASASSAAALYGTPSAAITFVVPNHTYGDPPFTVSATSTSTGAFTYSVLSGPATLTGSTVTITGAGMVVMQASQAAAEGYAAATQRASLTVASAPLTVIANNLARVFGASNPTFTGSVTGAVNGDTFTETFSTTATISSIVGSYPIVPSVTGANLADYTVNSTNGTLAVSQAGTATTFALSNGNTSLTATVASLTSGIPTGTVAFYEGQMEVGSGTLANGTASYTASALPSGDVVVSAQYSGDANFTQSASPPILVLSVVPANTSVTVANAGSVVDQVNLTPAPGYTGTVQLSCSGLPQNSSCDFQPASVAFTGSTSSSSASLTIQTGVSSSAAVQHPHSDGREGPAGTLAAVFWAPGLFLATFVRRRRSVRTRAGKLLVLAFLLCGMGAALGGCGGGSSSTNPAPTMQTPAGTYTVQLVTSGPGGFSQTASLNLTVQ